MVLLKYLQNININISRSDETANTIANQCFEKVALILTVFEIAVYWITH